MNNIDALFDRMDAWRHLPNYQLERRADIFFSLYLPEVLEKILGTPVLKDLIPEFPIHIETIYPDKRTDKSFKIDYVAFSEKLDKTVFIELKTDDSSLQTKQGKYLQAASDVGMSKLIEGLKKIFQATNSKQKYYCLFEQLEKIGRITIPDEVKEIINKPNLQGINKHSEKIRALKIPSKVQVVYVLPNLPDKEEKAEINATYITFNEFAGIVESYDDPVSLRFARSMREWAKRRPGERV